MSDKNNTICQVYDFIRVLDEHGVIVSSSPLYDLIKSLERTNATRGLSYKLYCLEFRNVSDKQLIRCDKWDGSGLSAYLNLDISLVENGAFKFGDVDSAVVEIVYEACSEDTAELAKGAWHLDYHKNNPKGSEPDFIHPSYHFHHGGRAIKDDISNYGDLLIMDAPRLMHPPLDLFLAIDFALTNFLDKRTWKNLRADTTYQEIVKESQKNWWKDYFQQISNYWMHSEYSGAESVATCDLARLSNPYLY
ncbi:hypothetical protein AYI92_15070 [Shewanella xiamenensis]|uniref:hypothetical protein n=1 Tax=Shewanella xiamenensis TaxID=332186 RepID=UPI0011860CE5|nr:hypothetical protein [Shewanella xiamenensis]TVL16725.1 hypothetical protein AYI90_14935 [Shewanella xiamenensis]TVL16738.1 hypothetical protein AYI91_14665 [Shewanella xiamenensis]TVL24203.1 hypothetical protein AYI92_15070 [Shewanella xiamenensis]TVL30398.1 hypothetical protein AYI93_14820 [Shewanella xiamenensis]TVP00027.1 hypothetical protein AYI89_15000 [Shewanella xiamenensis]